MKPLIIFNSIVTFCAFILANEVIPVTNASFAALLYSVREQRPEMIIKEGVFSNEIDGYSIKVDRRAQDSDLLYGIMIYDHTDGNGNTAVTIADSGYLNISDDKLYMILTLFSGESYTDVKPGSKEKKQSHPFRREKFNMEEVVIGVKDYDLKRVDDDLFKDGYRMLRNDRLKRDIDSLAAIYTEHEEIATRAVTYNGYLDESIQNQFKPDSLKITDRAREKAMAIDFNSLFIGLSRERKMIVVESAKRIAQANQRNVLENETVLYGRLKWLNRYVIEWHRKYTLSLACIIFFFIGAPIGAIIRKGGFGTPVVVSVLLFITYYLISMVGENVAREGVWDAGGAMWFSTFFFIIIGVFLSQQAVSDSLLMNSETYSKIIKRLNFLAKFLPQKEETEQNENPVLDE